MSLISEILGSIGLFCIQIISSIGYFGVFLLMVMESMIFPVPSELVMPFAGFLASSGEMNLILIILVSSLGSLCGSLLSYYIGKKWGDRFILKFGRYFLLTKEDIIKTESWFSKKGEATIFIGRFIPIVRHIISIPAGMGKMDIKKFSLYTLVGATLWNSFLVYLGFLFGRNWENIKQYSDYISYGVLALIIFIVIWFAYKRIKKLL